METKNQPVYERAASKLKYIDAREFTALFRNAEKNWESIAAGIHLIAQRFVSKYRSLPSAWRDDAASEAMLLGLAKISHYQKNCRHSNAFLYFTRVIQTKVWERFKVERRVEKGLSPFGSSHEQ